MFQELASKLLPLGYLCDLAFVTAGLDWAGLGWDVHSADNRHSTAQFMVACSRVIAAGKPISLYSVPADLLNLPEDVLFLNFLLKYYCACTTLICISKET
ncbi:hypothetical protein GUJ93_ZPchr0044g38078 [Zizania palustris]|uniref:Uncharacterized protein n=1 Tax=Zizania palustris TaxID=103762 RepID=A0A8J5V036_ZIZPA|nr:hypothetical protein GUJ93_ZPchr0044g38078 [Zizania palustris]